jgi:hypothetical protein
MQTMTRHLRLPLILFGGGLLLLVLKVYVPEVKTVALDLYTLTSSIYAAIAGPINNVRLGLGVPLSGLFAWTYGSHRPLSALDQCCWRWPTFYGRRAGPCWGKVLLF